MDALRGRRHLSGDLEREPLTAGVALKTGTCLLSASPRNSSDPRHKWKCRLG